MKRWFSGKLAGHYRGTLQPPSELAPVVHGEHFGVEIYEALVSEIELGPLEAPAPEAELTEEVAGASGVSSRVVEKKPLVEQKHHHVPTGPSLHQSHIGQVHFIDAVRRGQTIRGTAHDVLLSDLHFSHPARHGDVTFGRVEGLVSGWFRPPPEPEPIVEIDPPPAVAPIGWASDVVETKRATAALEAPPRTSMQEAEPTKLDDRAADEESGVTGGAEEPSPPDPENVRPLRATDERLMPAFRLEDLKERRELEEENDAPFDDEGDEDELGPHSERQAGQKVVPSPSREYPFFTLGACATVLLAFFASPFAAGLFALPFLFSYVLRRWLVGIVPDGAFTRFLSLCIGTGQVLLGALTIAHWVTLGCVALSPFSLLLLMGGQFTSSLLPRPLTYAIANGMLALVLLQAYASWALGPCS